MKIKESFCHICTEYIHVYIYIIITREICSVKVRKKDIKTNQVWLHGEFTGILQACNMKVLLIFGLVDVVIPIQPFAQ